MTTKLGLTDNTKSAAINILQSTLTDTIDLRLNVKQAHWTVRGPHFQQLHELFDSFVEPLDAEIDTMAERIATLGGVPDGRAHSVAAKTSLPTFPDGLGNGVAYLDLLASLFAELGNKVRKGIEETDEVGDADSADILTSTSRFLDQSLWFLEAHKAV